MKKLVFNSKSPYSKLSAVLHFGNLRLATPADMEGTSFMEPYDKLPVWIWQAKDELVADKLSFTKIMQAGETPANMVNTVFYSLQVDELIIVI